MIIWIDFRIRDQAIIALREACAAILVVDGQVGPTLLDEDIAKFLRCVSGQLFCIGTHIFCGCDNNIIYFNRKQTKTGVPVVLAVNKCESEKTDLLQIAEFWSMGLGEPLAISALHGNGVAEVLEAIMPHVYEADKVN